MSDKFLNAMLQLIDDAPLVNFIGASGTGKSSLAQFLVGSLLQRDEASRCAWIQASEPLAVSRLKRFFKDPSVLSRFFAFPRSPITSFERQAHLLRSIIKHDILLPPDTKFIVIDNISHHLRAELLNNEEVKHKILFQNKFFNETFFPFFMFIQREGLRLILIHEVSYSPKLDREVPFFHGLYENVEALNVYLKKDLFSQHRVMDISSKNAELRSRCEIHASKFVFAPIC